MLLDLASICWTQCPTLSSSSCREACKKEPTNATLLDAYSCLLAEVEDAQAVPALLRAIEVAPHSGHEKYMYLAQVSGATMM